MARSVPASALLFLLALSPARAAGAAHSDLAPPVTPIRYELDLALDYGEERLACVARLTFRNEDRTPVAEIPLLLYRLMRVDEVRDGTGNPIPFRQEVVAFEDFGRLQVNFARVSLAAPLAPGATDSITVRYGGYLLGYAETGSRYIRDHIAPEFTILRDDGYAFPRVGYPSMMAMRRAPPLAYAYRARIRVPDTLVVANGGRFVGRSAEAGTAVYEFVNILPCWRMDFAVARYGTSSRGPVRAYYLPGDSAGAEGVLDAAARALGYCERWFGPRRDASELTFLEIADGYGSQSDVTTILQTAAAFRDPERHGEVYHEVSHLWRVIELDRPGPRWNEGLATFLESLVSEKVRGRDLVRPDGDRTLAWLRERAPKEERLRTVPLAGYGAAQLTDYSYWVGAVAFCLIYEVAGEERFARMLRSFYQRYAATGATTDDLVRTVIREGGAPMRPLCEDWITTTRWTDRIRNAGTIEALAALYRKR
jgi:hypothetical protein